MTYNFKSDVTRMCLPTGYISADMVTREEVPVFLERIRVKAKIEGGDWIDTLVWSLLTNHSWTPEVVTRRINDLHDDIKTLMDLLLVNNTK